MEYNVYCDESCHLKSNNSDIQKGIDIIMNAILEPMRQIAENAGLNSNEIIKKQLNCEYGIGFDAKKCKWVSMLEAGIIDPALVTRTALINAASISALFITTEVGIVIDEEDEKNKDFPTMDMF